MDEINFKISDAEWVVMKILWQESPLTSTNIIEALRSKTNWKPKTIHSLIDRLVKKGALAINKDCSQFQFYPIVEKKDCVNEETKSFIEKVYNGSSNFMISSFIKNEKMSKDEIEDLQRLLNEKLKL